jgi:hypothetical protein
MAAPPPQTFRRRHRHPLSRASTALLLLITTTAMAAATISMMAGLPSSLAFVFRSRRPHIQQLQRQRQSLLIRCLWHGPTAPFSEYAMHVQVDPDDLPTTISQAIATSMGSLVAAEASDHEHEAAADTTSTVSILPTVQPLTPLQLLHLGSVWFSRPEEDTKNNNSKNYTTTDLSSLPPPKRLTLEDASIPLQPGDYLRIHHTPRRFPNVYQANWKAAANDNDNNKEKKEKSSVIVASNDESGYWIIDKPPLIPVHATVDNALENVVHQLQHANTIIVADNNSNINNTDTDTDANNDDDDVQALPTDRYQHVGSLGGGHEKGICCLFRSIIARQDA